MTVEQLKVSEGERVRVSSGNKLCGEAGVIKGYSQFSLKRGTVAYVALDNGCSTWFPPCCLELEEEVEECL